MLIVDDSCLVERLKSGIFEEEVRRERVAYVGIFAASNQRSLALINYKRYALRNESVLARSRWRLHGLTSES